MNQTLLIRIQSYVRTSLLGLRLLSYVLDCFLKFHKCIIFHYSTFLTAIHIMLSHFKLERIIMLITSIIME